MKRYILFVEGDVEPNVLGPYKSEAERDNVAKGLRNLHGDQHGIYQLDVSDKGIPTTATWSSGFFEGSGD